MPRTTEPPGRPLSRRHSPHPAGTWGAYRACIRWDFGFTCAFCLLHEADFFGGAGGEGLAVTTIEHRVPRSEAPEREADYSNCLYACRLCNRARGRRPVEHRGRRLLDPTRYPWAAHFEAVGDRLEVVENDEDAKYTHEAYDLDDERKTERRKLRRELITDRLKSALALEDLDAALDSADELLQRDRVAFSEILRAIKGLRAQTLRTLSDLGRYLATPADAPTDCRCGTTDHHSLPVQLAEQTLETPDSWYE